MSEGIQAMTHDERVADRLAELQAERDAAVLALVKMREALEDTADSEYPTHCWCGTGTPLDPLPTGEHYKFCQRAQAALADPGATALAAEAREMREVVISARKWEAEASRLLDALELALAMIDERHFIAAAVQHCREAIDAARESGGAG